MQDIAKKSISFHCSIPVSFKRGRYTYGLCEYNTLIKINKLYYTSFLPKNPLYNHIFFFIGGFLIKIKVEFLQIKSLFLLFLFLNKGDINEEFKLFLFCHFSAMTISNFFLFYYSVEQVLNKLYSTIFYSCLFLSVVFLMT